MSRWGGHTIPAGTRTEDVVRSTAVFGGPKLVSTARSFHGGWLTAIFGGITLDLRGAQPAPEGASINATVAFGGIDILVPKGWRISLRTTPIFGGVEDKTDHSARRPDAPVLHVDAVALFGGSRSSARSDRLSHRLSARFPGWRGVRAVVQSM